MFDKFFFVCSSFSIGLQLMPCQFAQLDQARLKQVLLQSLVCHDRPDAVLAEAAWLDAERPKDIEDGTIHVAVALQFNDDERSHVSILPRLVVVEADVIVDGQSFRLAGCEPWDECLPGQGGPFPAGTLRCRFRP